MIPAAYVPIILKAPLDCVLLAVAAKTILHKS
jgi:hypothetical protein